MSIAQHFVAGEGVAHPQQAETEPPQRASFEIASLTCDAINLPWLVFRAAHRAAHVDGLPPRARTVLAALARTVDAADPYAAIFARRELLTGRAMQSMRTFYRSLDDLEAAGLITRPPQRRYVQAGLFGRAYLHLTEQAAVLLGLAEGEPKPEAGFQTQLNASGPALSRLKDTPESEPDGSVATESAPSFRSPSVTLADGAIYKDLYPKAFQKRQPGQLPADLQRLRSLGFHDFLTFKMMREAKEHGKRLSDVVEASWEHLKHARAPVNYLRALLRSTVDFAYRLRTQQAARQDRHDQEARRLHAEQTAQRSAGRTFVSTDREHQVVIAADGESMTVYRLDEAIPRVAAGQWKISFAAALQAGRLRPATTADHALFAHAMQPRAVSSKPQRATTPVPSGERVLTSEIREQLSKLRGILRARGPGIGYTA